MKIMDSYVNAPLVHANAVKNPKMLGGPFIDYGGKRVDEIIELRRYTKDRLKSLIELSGAIADLDELLRTKATGFSLQPLYLSVPDILRGYVELVYDLNNHASFRLIEPLLYRSQFYFENQQSFMLSLITRDDRPFILSTPRLEDERSLHLKVPYRDEVIDDLFSTKAKPRPWSFLLVTGLTGPAPQRNCCGHCSQKLRRKHMRHMRDPGSGGAILGTPASL